MSWQGSASWARAEGWVRDWWQVGGCPWGSWMGDAGRGDAWLEGWMAGDSWPDVEGWAAG